MKHVGKLYAMHCTIHLQKKSTDYDLNKLWHKLCVQYRHPLWTLSYNIIGNDGYRKKYIERFKFQ